MTDTDTTPSNDLTKTLGLDQPPSRFAHLRPYLVAGVVLALLIAVLLIWKGKRANRQPGYQTQEVRQGNLVVSVSATGTLESTNQVDVGSEISGTIKTVEVDYNSLVKKGQILARIDTARLEAQVAQTAASLETARSKVLQMQATIIEAKAKLARLVQVQKESNGKVPSKAEMDSAIATLDRALADEASARAGVSQAVATLQTQQIDLSKALIRSPINGVVLKRAAEPGQTVAASFQTPVLFTLAEDLTQMELHVDVDEADVGKVRTGQSAGFTVAAYPDRIFPATISQVRFGAKTVAGVVTYETVLRVDNRELLLRPGMTGTATITVNKADKVLLVPNSALRFTPPVAPDQPTQGSGGLVSKLLPRPPSQTPKKSQESEGKSPRVWLLREGTLQQQPITTGLSDGTMTEVKSGLTAGMQVVVDSIEEKN